MKYRLWSYWLYSTRDEISVWQIVPFPEDPSKLSSPRTAHDMCVLSIFDSSHSNGRAEVGELHPYYKAILTSPVWTPILKKDIELIVLGHIV